ncbi:MAG: hypothetical protein K6G47_08130 [Clostridia bacterium]|nr:hypothetical protein [Clostridia bacterium]
MNSNKRLRGLTALLISLLMVICAVGFGNDVLADGTSDSVSLRSVWGEGATVDISGSGYQPNSTFTITVNFNMSVSVVDYWEASSASASGSSVTLTVTSKADGSYTCGMNLSGSGFVDYAAEGQPVIFAFTGSSSTGSAPKAEPAAPKPDENKPAPPKPNEKKPAAPKPDENKPAAPKPGENKPADPKADEKKAEEPKQAEPAKQDQNNNNNNSNNDNNNTSKNTATSTPTAAPTGAQDNSKSSTSSNSGSSDSSATAAPTKSASTDSAATTTAPKTIDAPSSDNNNEKKNETDTTETSSKTEPETTETTEETEPENTEETEPSESVAAVVNETEAAEVAVVIDEGTDGTGEPTPTPTAPIKVNGIITPHGGRKDDGMSWWAFILILVGIGVVVRLAILKSQGVDNSELAFEFIPLGAIKNKFKKDAAPVEEKNEDEPKVVNGYLKKSDTAAIRPVYSNAASGSASRVRGGTKQTPRVDEPSTATSKVTTNKVSSSPSKKTTTSSSSSSSKTAFNHAQAMKELRAMEEAEKNGR